MHQRYVNNRAAGAGFCCFLTRCIAHRKAINSVNRHVVVHYQVTDDRVCHALRSLYAGLSSRMRVALHFNDIPFLTLQLCSNLIQSFFRFVIQHSLCRAEMKLSIGDLLVLVDVADRRIQLAGLGSCLLRNLLRLASLGRSLQGLLVRLLGGRLRLLDTGLGATVHVFDIVRVLGV